MFYYVTWHTKFTLLSAMLWFVLSASFLIDDSGKWIHACKLNARNYFKFYWRCQSFQGCQTRQLKFRRKSP